MIGRRDAPRLLAAALLVIAVVFAIVVGVLWFGWNSDHRRAAARDAAVDGARQSVLDIQTLDTADVDGTLRRMGDAMTGDLRKDWDDKERASTEERLKQYSGEQLKTNPVVASAAATQFDYDGGTAKVLVYLVVKQSTGGKEAENAYRWTYVMSMTKVGDAWKASAMQPLQERAAVGPADPSSPATAVVPTSADSAAPATESSATGTPTTESPAPSAPAAPATDAPATTTEAPTP